MHVSNATHSIWKLRVILLLFVCKQATSKCLGSSGLVCCVGFVWNVDKNKCEKCPVGYYNENCSEKCMYPSYGEDCQGECHCTQPMCNFITGCSDISSSVNYESQKTTTINENYSNASDLHAVHITESITRAGLEDVTKSNPQITINSEYIVYGVFGLIVVFLLLFAAFVSAYIYKQYNRYNLNRNKPEVSVTQQRQYQGLVTQPETPVSDGEVETSFPYLQPVFHQHYEESVSLEINAEDVHNSRDENAYLSPIKKVCNIYAEFISDADQV